MPYWRLFYHIVFATRNREALITADIEEALHGYLASKAASLEASVYAINGIEDHVHIVASLPPKIAVADFVGQLKGASSHHVNHLPGREQLTFDWQRGYGVMSFGAKQLDWAIRYVRQQKEHHRNGKTVWELETDQEAERA